MKSPMPSGQALGHHSGIPLGHATGEGLDFEGSGDKSPLTDKGGEETSSVRAVRMDASLSLISLWSIRGSKGNGGNR